MSPQNDRGCEIAPRLRPATHVDVRVCHVDCMWECVCVWVWVKLVESVPRGLYVRVCVWVWVKLVECEWSYCMCDKVVCVWVCVKLLYVKFVCEVIVCERWYVTKLCVCESVWNYCMLSLCVWSYCMWEMVCDKVVCVCVLVCVKLLYVKFVCVWSYGMWHVWRWRREAGGGGGRRRSRPGIQNQKQEPHTKLWGISFGGIPNSRNVLFLQIFLKRAAKPSAGNTSAGFPGIKWPQILLNMTWLCTKASQIFSGTPEPSPQPVELDRNLLQNPVEPDLALHQSLPDLLRNLLRNPVEPDLALHQSLPEPSPEPSWEPCWTWPGFAPKPPRPSWEPSPEPSLEPCWTWPGSAPTGTFSGTLLNLTSLCTKASHTFSGTFETLLNLTRNPVEPDLAHFSGIRSLLQNPVEPDLALHRSLPDLLRNLLQNPVEPDLCTKASQTFSGTFSGTLLNVTCLCIKASQTFSGTFGTFSGTSLNLTQRLHQCTRELFWAEDTISLRCWGKKKRKAELSAGSYKCPPNSIMWRFLAR